MKTFLECTKCYGNPHRLTCPRCNGLGVEREQPEYLEFIREINCIKCMVSHTSVAHHETLYPNEKGTGIKVPDINCFPLCWSCHALRHDRGIKKFWKPHTEKELIQLKDMLNGAYKRGVEGERIKVKSFEKRFTISYVMKRGSD